MYCIAIRHALVHLYLKVKGTKVNMLKLISIVIFSSPRKCQKSPVLSVVSLFIFVYYNLKST